MNNSKKKTVIDINLGVKKILILGAREKAFEAD